MFRQLPWKRAAAYLIDILILFFVLSPIGWLIQRALDWSPDTGFEIWCTLAVNFSIPIWIYFIVSDSAPHRGTYGKRMMGIVVAREDGSPLPRRLAVARTAVKLFPWELTHWSAFGMASDSGEWTMMQSVGLVAANALIVVFVATFLSTGGRRTIHDFCVGSQVLARPRRSANSESAA